MTRVALRCYWLVQFLDAHGAWEMWPTTVAAYETPVSDRLWHPARPVADERVSLAAPSNGALSVAVAASSA